MKPAVTAGPDIEILSQSAPFSGRATLRLVTFRHRRFDHAWSAPITWELWQRGRAAAMLPYDPVSDCVVMIDQFRLPAYAAGFAGPMREIPAGLCEPGEDPEATMRREIVEEAGLTARRMHRIGAFVLSPGGSDETIEIYAGEVTAPPLGVAGVHGLAAENEDIRVVVVPAEQAIAQALDGLLPNSVATIGLLWLAGRRALLRELWR